MNTEQQAIIKVAQAFDTFKEAYDVFVKRVEDVVPEEANDEYLWDQVSSLVLGSDDVAIYLRDYSATVDRLRSLLRK